MKRIKFLFDNYFYQIMTILSAVAFVAGVALLNYTLCIYKERQEAVDSAPAVSVESTTTTTTTATTTTTTAAPAKRYFDVPLSGDLQEHIFAECDKYGIPPEIAIAMIDVESDFDPSNMGDGGNSYGLMQIQPRWHSKRMQKLGCTDLLNPYQNVTVGVDYLAELLDRYEGDIAKALTAYNQGSFKGTVTNYAKKVLKTAERIEKE